MEAMVLRFGEPRRALMTSYILVREAGTTSDAALRCTLFSRLIVS